MVYSPLKAASKYFRHYIHAANNKGYGTHSPFVFEFITKVLSDHTSYDEYKSIESYRKKLLQDTSIFSGAGINQSCTMAAMAKRSGRFKKYDRLLYRIIKYYGAENVFVYDCLGITTSYLAAANKNANVCMISDRDIPVTFYNEHFHDLQITNIQVLSSKNQENIIDHSTQKNIWFDFVFININKIVDDDKTAYELIAHLHQSAFFVVDNIHTNKYTEAVWQKLTQHEKVFVSIDLYDIGILVFREFFMQKQQVAIRF